MRAARKSTVSWVKGFRAAHENTVSCSTGFKAAHENYSPWARGIQVEGCAREHFVVQELQLRLQCVPLVGAVSEGPHAQHGEAQLLRLLEGLDHLRRPGMPPLSDTLQQASKDLRFKVWGLGKSGDIGHKA